MRSRARRLAAAPGPREATPMKIDLVYIAKQNERILDKLAVGIQQPLEDA
jgi:hypothetical protein